MIHEKILPLIAGFHSDPTICRSGHDYFIATSTCEYFPGVTLHHSKDMVTWKQVGYVLTRPSQLPLKRAWISSGIYAPTLREHNGVFYLVTTNVCVNGIAKNFIVQTTDPFGPWSDPVWIADMEGIDPDLFWDTDGTAYAQWSWRNMGVPGGICIGQAKFDPADGKFLETPRVLWEGTGGLGPEGSHLYKIGEWYYLYIAEGGTEYGHMQTIARSRKVSGPFESCPRNPVLTHRSLGSAVHAVGHADLVQTPSGEWYGVCHGIRPKGYHLFHVLGRETFLYPVHWDSEGWPVIGDHGRLPENPVTIGGREVEPVDSGFEDDFTDSAWPFSWNWLRNPVETNYVRKGDGSILLKGSPDKLDGYDSPTWVGVRQREHSCRVEAKVVLNLEWYEAEAGLVIFQNLDAHCVVGVRRASGITRLFTRRKIGSLLLDTDGPLLPTHTPALTLVIEASDNMYQLGMLDSAGVFIPLTQIEAKFLSTEVSGRFTGVYFALHALGESSLRCTHFQVKRTTR